MPTNYFLALMALSIISHFFIPLGKLLYYPVTYVGYLLLITGITLNLWTDRLFKENETTVKPHLEPAAFITSGPFRVSRHPMYLGMALVLLGVAVIHGTIISFLYPVIFVMLMEALFIPVEETNLKRVFGKDYLDYQKKVRKWA
jgi:protein-S-isoprenylcysteine O-methyltransferase Ste14